MTNMELFLDRLAWRVAPSAALVLGLVCACAPGEVVLGERDSGTDEITTTDSGDETDTTGDEPGPELPGPCARYDDFEPLDGEPDQRVDLSWDDAGHLLLATRRALPSEEELERTEHEWDAEGRELVRREYVAGELSRTQEWAYDDEGRLILHDTMLPDLSGVRTTITRAPGSRSTETDEGRDGSIDRVELALLDGEGRELDVALDQDNDGAWDWRALQIWDGEVVVEYSFDVGDDGSVDERWVASLDADQRPYLTDHDDDGDGAFDRRVTRSWDEHGELALQEAHEADDGPLIERYAYQRDAQGRLLLRLFAPGAIFDERWTWTYEDLADEVDIEHAYDYGDDGEVDYRERRRETLAGDPLELWIDSEADGLDDHHSWWDYACG